MLVFWGEEKALSGAKQDLINKFQAIDPFTFGDLKFMICYTVNGSKLRFYVIDPTLKQPERFMPLTSSLDIATTIGRFGALRATFNLARVLMTIKDAIPTIPYPLGKAITTGSTKITYLANHVVKRLPASDLPYGEGDELDDRVSFLVDMYSYARDHRGLVRVKVLPTLIRKYYQVILETKGLQRRPQDEKELKVMVKDLVSGIAWLNQGGFLHRDIRMPNIVYDPVVRQYVLIDFEHGYSMPEQGPKIKRQRSEANVTLLKEWDTETLVDGKYTKVSEMYQLGKLLRQEFLALFSPDGMVFLDLLASKQMTAETALMHGWLCDAV